MKLFKRILATTLAIALVALLPQATMKVKAAGTTYSLKYVPSMSEWRAQPLSSWDLSKGTGDLAYLYQNIKDGDTLVILGETGAPNLTDLKISAKLENLTIYNVTTGVTFSTTAEVKDVYVLKGSVASLNGTCKNVYIYDDSICNVMNDAELISMNKESSMKMNVAAVGKVAHVQFVDNGRVLSDTYNYAANSLRVENGENKTPTTSYSATPTNFGSSSGSGSGSGNSSSGGSSTNNGSTSPKTGENATMIILFAGAVLCFAGAAYSKKKIAR
ncbi:MAG: LPXTG cell wall anchor domain-containing protein [Lachnospiraceae bacterium]|nr:LPXTG cell wall anchor domain-containing protein [Lachnospiraceae bacterium]